MAGEFSEIGIVNPSVRADDSDLIVSWSVDPSAIEVGSEYFQVYVNKKLVWSGPERVAILPGLNVAGEPILLHVGTVAEGNRLVNYSVTLSALPGGGNRALLEWYGGGWEKGVTQYLIFGSILPNGPIDMTAPVDRVGSAGPAGFGRGPFGLGPFGYGSRRYRWTSGPLAGGTWLWAIVPATVGGFRAADNTTLSVTITAPPDGPKAVNGKKIWISAFDPANGRFTVAWNLPNA